MHCVSSTRMHAALATRSSCIEKLVDLSNICAYCYICNWGATSLFFPPEDRSRGPRLTATLLTVYDRRMAMSSVATDRVRMAPAAALFGSLADPTRLAILLELAVRPSRVVDLRAHLGLAQSTVSQHLACLRDCGLVAAQPVGRSTFYTLAQPELRDLLEAAEAVLASTGNAVALCPNCGAQPEES